MAIVISSMISSSISPRFFVSMIRDELEIHLKKRKKEKLGRNFVSPQNWAPLQGKCNNANIKFFGPIAKNMPFNAQSLQRNLTCYFVVFSMLSLCCFMYWFVGPLQNPLSRVILKSIHQVILSVHFINGRICFVNCLQFYSRALHIILQDGVSHQNHVWKFFQ